MQPSQHSPGDPHDLLVGARIDDRYSVIGRLGRGAQAVVYDAVHDELGRPVAIKVLDGPWASEATAVSRFLREARTASALSHSHIVDVSDLGRLPDGRPYLVMPKILGTPLRELLTAHGPQSPARVARLLAGVGSALDLIHARGFVHRDIKPENLMHVPQVDGAETVVLLDFGIAVFCQSPTTRLTQRDAIFGTPEYMAPEVWEGKLPDGRGDVYALATVAFELITGKLPFHGANPLQLLATKYRSPAPRLSAVGRMSFSGEIESVFRRALAREPGTRTARAGIFVAALLDAADGGRTSLDPLMYNVRGPSIAPPAFGVAPRALGAGADQVHDSGPRISAAALAREAGAAEGPERHEHNEHNEHNEHDRWPRAGASGIEAVDPLARTLPADQLAAAQAAALARVDAGARSARADESTGARLITRPTSHVYGAASDAPLSAADSAYALAAHAARGSDHAALGGGFEQGVPSMGTLMLWRAARLRLTDRLAQGVAPVGEWVARLKGDLNLRHAQRQVRRRPGRRDRATRVMFRRRMRAWQVPSRKVWAMLGLSMLTALAWRDSIEPPPRESSYDRAFANGRTAAREDESLEWARERRNGEDESDRAPRAVGYTVPALPNEPNPSPAEAPNTPAPQPPAAAESGNSDQPAGSAASDVEQATPPTAADATDGQVVAVAERGSGDAPGAPDLAATSQPAAAASAPTAPAPATVAAHPTAMPASTPAGSRPGRPLTTAAADEKTSAPTAASSGDATPVLAPLKAAAVAVLSTVGLKEPSKPAGGAHTETAEPEVAAANDAPAADPAVTADAPAAAAAQPADTKPDDKPEAADQDSAAPRKPGYDVANAEAGVSAATSLLLQGQPDPAIERFREVLSSAPSHASAWRGLGLAFERKHDTFQALDAYEHYLELAPEGPQLEAVRKRMRAISP